jgi:hypothetical protein
MTMLRPTVWPTKRIAVKLLALPPVKIFLPQSCDPSFTVSPALRAAHPHPPTDDGPHFAALRRVCSWSFPIRTGPAALLAPYSWPVGDELSVG